MAEAGRGFKPGDKVKCVKSHSGLMEGAEYVVREESRGGAFVRVTNDRGHAIYYDVNRFVLIDPGKDLDEFKALVRARVIEEADEHGWLSGVDGLLISLGLEPRKPRVPLPTAEGSAVLLDNGLVLVLRNGYWASPYVTWPDGEARGGGALWMPEDAQEDVVRVLYDADAPVQES